MTDEPADIPPTAQQTTFQDPNHGQIPGQGQGQTQGQGQGPYQGPPMPPPGYQGHPGYPPPGYPGGPGYGPYGPYPPFVPAPPTNTMAILSIIFAFVFCPLGIVFGIIAKSQIRRTGEGGSGLAVAGISVGAVFSAFYVIMIIVWVTLFATLVHSMPNDFPTPDPSLIWLLRG